ncbi:hypothetical protein H4R99_005224, partial [Coemansia sp. RSA 1722]
MNHQNSPDRYEHPQQYTGAEIPEFGQSAPSAQPRRLQRLSRNSQSPSVHNQQQQQQYYQPSPNQSFQNMQPYPSHQYPGGHPAPRPSQSQASLFPQQRSNTLTRNSTTRDSYQRPPHQLLQQQQQQQQQQQYTRP